MIAVDTNVVVRLLTEDDPKQAASECNWQNSAENSNLKQLFSMS